MNQTEAQPTVDTIRSKDL